MGVADIGIRVFLDDAASAGLLNINQGMSRLLSTSSAAGESLNKMVAIQAGVAGATLGFGAAFLAFGGAIKYSVDAADELQQAMFGVAVATHVPMSVAMQYTTALMNLAASSTYSTAEIADGVALLGRSGYTIADIFNGMAKAGIALGIATRSTAVQGFGMLAQAMAAYKAPAEQAMQYADLIQYGFERQRSSVSQFATALSQVTPVAAQMHIPLETIIAALDTIGPSMVNTGVAGTALRYMIQGLYTPTAAAQTELKALGLGAVDAGGNFRSAFYNADGSAKDFQTAILLLSGKLKGLDQEAQMNALKALFSVRGGQGADILLGDISKMLGELKNLKSTSDNAGGAMSRWQQIMQTLGGATAGFQSSLKDLGAAVGLTMIPSLTNLITWANQTVSAIRAFAMANPEAAKTFLSLGLAISGLGTVAGGVFLLFTHPVLGIMVGAFLAAIVVTAGLAAAFTYVHTHMAQITPIVNQVVGVLRTLAVIALGVGGAFLGIHTAIFVVNMLAGIPAAMQFGTTLLTSTVPALIRSGIALAQYGAQMAVWTVITIARAIPTIILSTAAWIGNAVAVTLAAAPILLIIAIVAAMVIGLGLLIAHLGGMNLLIRAGQAIWGGIVATFNMVAAIIRGAVLQAIQQLQPIWVQLVASFNQARPALMFLGQILGAVIVVALGLLIAGLRGGIMALAQFIVAIITIAARLAQVFMGIAQVFTGFFTVLHGLVTGNTAQIRAGFETMGSGIRNIVTGLIGAVVAVFVGGFNIIKGFVSGFIAGIVGFFHSLSNVLVGHSIIPDMMTAIMNVIRSGLASVISGIISFVSQAISNFLRMGSLVVSTAVNAFNAFRAAVQVGIQFAVSVVASGASNMISRVQSLGSMIISSAVNAWNGFRNAVSNGVNTALGFVQSLPGRVVGALAGLGSMLFSSGATAMQMFASGLASAIGAVVSQVQQAAATVANFLGHHSPAKMGPLSDDDKWMPNMMNMFAKGISDHAPLVQKATAGVAGNIANVPSIARVASAGGGSAVPVGGARGTGTSNFYFQVDSKTVSQMTINWLTGQMQMNGMARLNR